LTISDRVLDDAEPVYTFGYPLGSAEASQTLQGILVGHVAHGPRVTSAIVASKIEATQMLTAHGQPPTVYALDKALNYGNSGGPIVATDTGKVYGVCVRFQPVAIPQEHLTEPGRQLVHVRIPSLYGLASNLTRSDLAPELLKRGLTIDSN
jgi:S1-C subfamily serine protease